MQEGIASLSILADKEPNDLLHIKGIGPKTAVLAVNRAKSFVSNEAIPISKPNVPTAHTEIYLDLESVQVGSPRLEDTRYYLFGWCIHIKDGETKYHYELAEGVEQEYEIWQKFLTQISDTSGPIFHYSNYEKTAMTNLIRRYGNDDRASVLFPRFVDLYQEVKNNVALPLSSYSIKMVAPWLGYKWIGEVQNAADTMIEYSRWQRTRNRKHLENILVYNEHDCRAMIVIKDWLLEIETQF